CALYLETDEGTAYALLDDEDPSGACPNLDALVSGMTIRIPLADLTAVTDPTVTAALDATFTFGADHYVFVGAPPSAF
ncbi:MAG: hypothetical protein K0V04_37055, partial [Deltaproteobacteria bacterium]|nr:hypothetical protein [Deltaproteobacteria bacterium]